MRPALAARLAASARDRDRSGLRRARIQSGGIGVELQRRGRALVNFCSNDYLGLSGHPEVIDALAAGARAWGAGAGASPLVTGYRNIHRELESELAGFFGFEAACLFPSGYQANLAVGQGLLGSGQGLVADRLNHASLNDAGRLAGARIRRYRHGDGAAAASRVNETCVALATDGVFSMDGDLAPVAELADLADRHGLALWLDDAHGIGVLGSGGRGTLEQLGIDPVRVDVFVGTFGKALGTGGAFVAGDRALIEALENTARGLIYSTAPPPAVAAATLKALAILGSEHRRRAALRERIEQFRDRARRLPLELKDSVTPIQPLMVGSNHEAAALSEALATEGYLVTPIRPPTVPEGTARLRITLSAAHTEAQVAGLLDALERSLA